MGIFQIKTSIYEVYLRTENGKRSKFSQLKTQKLTKGGVIRNH
jgi:hypothetical protein